MYHVSIACVGERHYYRTAGVNNNYLRYEIPDDHNPGMACLVEESCEVPTKEGGDEVTYDVLSRVPLVEAAGAAVAPVELDHPVAVLHDLVRQLGQQSQDRPD